MIIIGKILVLIVAFVGFWAAFRLFDRASGKFANDRSGYYHDVLLGILLIVCGLTLVFVAIFA